MGAGWGSGGVGSVTEGASTWMEVSLGVVCCTGTVPESDCSEDGAEEGDTLPPADALPPEGGASSAIKSPLELSNKTENSNEVINLRRFFFTKKGAFNELNTASHSPRAWQAFLLCNSVILPA